LRGIGRERYTHTAVNNMLKYILARVEAVVKRRQMDVSYVVQGHTYPLTGINFVIFIVPLIIEEFC
jgi:hypothetical protein